MPPVSLYISTGFSCPEKRLTPARKARTARQRALGNENDENSVTQRVTRAKAAALDKNNEGTVAVKKPLQANKGAGNTKSTTENPTRKRVALGDVSNTNKAGDGDKPAQAKKAATGPAGKAAAPTGVQKASPKKTSKAASNRTALGDKDKNSTSNANLATGNDLKRPASSTGINGPASKRRNGSSASTRKSAEVSVDENVAPPQQTTRSSTAPSSHENVKVRVTQTIKTDLDVDGSELKKEVETCREPLEDMDSEEQTLLERLQQQIDEMDEEDTGDPLMVSEYVYEILDYMKDLEKSSMPNPDYMNHQGELEWRMRGVLVDWLLEVHQRFHLLPETFYLTVNIIDRFLTRKVVQLERLQLVGVAAMFIAAKYEEVLSPHIANFVRVADDGFTEAEILSAERYILQTLEYDLSFPNPMHFMRRISKADNYDIQTRTLAKYLLEITLLDHRFLEFAPSLNSAAAMHLSRLILDKGEWNDILVHYSGYLDEDTLPVMELMVDYLRNPVVHHAFYRKYAHKKFLRGKTRLHIYLDSSELLTYHSLSSCPTMGKGQCRQFPQLVRTIVGSGTNCLEICEAGIILFRHVSSKWIYKRRIGGSQRIELTRKEASVSGSIGCYGAQGVWLVLGTTTLKPHIPSVVGVVYVYVYQGGPCDVKGHVQI